MRSANIYVNGIHAGIFEEIVIHAHYRFCYLSDYHGDPVSLTWPLSTKVHEFQEFPAFLDGLLPEGLMLDALLRGAKIDRTDLFRQLIAVGEDLVGAVQVRERL